MNGGIAQLARAIGSYPIGRGFKSNFRYHAWQSLCQRNAVCRDLFRPVGQEAKTPPFHGGNGSSILPRVTNLPANCIYGPLVKRLRHRPFTAVTGVRFSHGSSCAAVPSCTAFSLPYPSPAMLAHRLVSAWADSSRAFVSRAPFLSRAARFHGNFRKNP